MLNLHTLLEVGKKEQQSFCEKNKNTRVHVLVERKSPHTFLGWSENYLPCDETNFIPDIPLDQFQRGTIITGTYLGRSEKTHIE